MEEAPTKDPVSLLVLYALADRANDDGSTAYPSQEWIAARARCSVRTVRRKLADLETAGLIRKGNPKFVEHIRKDRRPMVWNLNLTATTTGQNHVPPQTPTGGHSCPGGQNDRADTPGTTTGQITPHDRTQLCPTNRPEPSLTIPSIERTQNTKEAPQQKIAHPLPENWEPTQKVKQDLANEYPTYDLARILQDFHDYWHSQPPSKAKKTNWDLTFRRWVRKETNPPLINQRGHMRGYSSVASLQAQLEAKNRQDALSQPQTTNSSTTDWFEQQINNIQAIGR